MKNKLYIIFIFFIFISCSERKTNFNPQVWKTTDGLYQGHRKAMLSDLLENHLKFGMEYDQVEILIGNPKIIDECNSNYIYEIEEKYGIIDPNGYKLLELEFNNEGKLIMWKIIETEFKE